MTLLRLHTINFAISSVERLWDPLALLPSKQTGSVRQFESDLRKLQHTFRHGVVG